MLDRIDWDTYFMSLCFLISSRSLDPSTKHGAIAVDEENSILATGYNSPPRGCDDLLIPLTRPEKYDHFLHSETALFCNAARNGVRLKGARLYITGPCCHLCLREIINVGISEIIQGPQKSNCIDDKSLKVKERLLKGQTLKIRDFGNMKNTRDLMADLFARTSDFVP